MRKDVITSKRIIVSQAPTCRRKKTTNDKAIKRIGASEPTGAVYERIFSRLQYKKDAAVTSRDERYRSNRLLCRFFSSS